MIEQYCYFTISAVSCEQCCYRVSKWIKTVLHYAIIRATCVATAKSALLQLHEQRCYTLQCFLQIVSQLVPLGTRLRLKAYFYWLIAQNIARQVARGVLHCAMLQKSVAALPQSLRKVELDSTSCNACCNKNVARQKMSSFTKNCIV